jgi:hypothetical protein
VVDRAGDSGDCAPGARSPVVDDLLEVELHCPCLAVASPIYPRATYFQLSFGTLARPSPASGSGGVLGNLAAT